MLVNDILNVIRLLLILAACLIFIRIYLQVRFKGFLTLTVGTIFSLAALISVKLKLIEPNGFTYEFILLWVALMWILSACLIFYAFKNYPPKH